MLAEPLAAALGAARAAQSGEGVRGDAHAVPVAGRQAAHASAGRRTGRRRGAHGTGAGRGALRGNRRAVVRARSRRGDRGRRFRRFRRRAAGVDADRRGAALAARCVERRGVGAAGFVRRRDSSIVRTTRGRRCTQERRVPEVLLSGNHEAIRVWRLQQALGRTWERRPDLLEGRELSAGGARAAGGVSARADGGSGRRVVAERPRTRRMDR